VINATRSRRMWGVKHLPKRLQSKDAHQNKGVSAVEKSKRKRKRKKEGKKEKEKRKKKKPKEKVKNKRKIALVTNKRKFRPARLGSGSRV